MNDGYWCLWCKRLIEANEDGQIIHDNVPHPVDAAFEAEDEKPQ